MKSPKPRTAVAGDSGQPNETSPSRTSFIMPSGLAGYYGVVQRKAEAGAGADAAAQGAAAAGTSGAAGALPYAAAIQRSFGRHDVGGIKAHTDTAAQSAARTLGAEAFATGDRVAFGATPTLHTAAHEAAHVIQQRAGIHLKGGVGEDHDCHEQHADAVADMVVQGRSAESLLDRYAPSANGGGALQLMRIPGTAVDSAQLTIDQMEQLQGFASMSAAELDALLDRIADFEMQGNSSIVARASALYDVIHPLYEAAKPPKRKNEDDTAQRDEKKAKTPSAEDMDREVVQRFQGWAQNNPPAEGEDGNAYKTRFGLTLADDPLGTRVQPALANVPVKIADRQLVHTLITQNAGPQNDTNPEVNREFTKMVSNDLNQQGYLRTPEAQQLLGDVHGFAGSWMSKNTTPQQPGPLSQLGGMVSTALSQVGLGSGAQQGPLPSGDLIFVDPISQLEVPIRANFTPTATQVSTQRLLFDGQGNRPAWRYYHRGPALEKLVQIKRDGILPDPDAFWFDEHFAATEDWVYMPAQSDDPVVRGQRDLAGYKQSVAHWAQRLNRQAPSPPQDALPQWQVLREQLVEEYITGHWRHPLTKRGI